LQTSGQNKHPQKSRIVIETLSGESTRAPIDLTLWLNMQTIQQDDLLEALHNHPDINIEVIFAHPLTPARSNLGWSLRPVAYRFQILDQRFPPLSAVAWAVRSRKRTHIVGGLWAVPALAVALIILRLLGAHIIIYSEAPKPFAQQSRLIESAKNLFGQWISRGRLSGLLAVSFLARRAFRSFPFRQVYSFAYFLAPIDPSGPTIGEPDTSPEVEIIYVGQLVERKGVDLLLEAASSLQASGYAFRLTLVGDGASRHRLMNQVSRMPHPEWVTFAGVLAHDAVRPRMRTAGLFVLPSRFDGWGMVVNEALSVGVPAIVSDACGAAELIQDGVNGYVFRAQDVVDLRDKLQSFLALTEAQRAAMRQRAFETSQTITADKAADYLVQCLRHLRGEREQQPVPPWKPNSAEV
jgi:glycosyltransferase involved in cell wall biosynthesis